MENRTLNGLFVGLSLLGLAVTLKRHTPWATEHPDFYTRAWLAAGLAGLVFSAVILWLDRYEREPWRLLLVAFLWGAMVAPAVLRPTHNFLTALRRERVRGEVSAVIREYRRDHEVEIPGSSTA